MTREKDEVLKTDDTLYQHIISDPIGYGWCKLTSALCVFDYTHTVRCSMHPTRCGNIERPQFIRRADKETYRVKKAVENNSEADSDLDPNAHQ